LEHQALLESKKKLVALWQHEKRKNSELKYSNIDELAESKKANAIEDDGAENEAGKAATKRKIEAWKRSKAEEEEEKQVK
jgi:hypothetical protein